MIQCFWKPLLRALKSDAAGGISMLLMTAVALGLANSPHAETFTAIWERRFPGQLGGIELEMTLKNWINQGLMALFFLQIGLEMKRELIDGELSSLRRAALPLGAALGGMAAPVLLYLGVTHGTEVERGWAVPMATDIAFAVSILAMLGDRVPAAAKVFVTALAVVDDLGAVLVIAFVYSDKLHATWFLAVAAAMILLGVLNRLHVWRLSAYLFAGALLWGAMLSAGVHATVAGVLLGLFVPLRGPGDQAAAVAPLHRLERGLKVPVALLVLPVFALANAGVALPLRPSAIWQAIQEPVTLGIALGLLVGKPLGVLGPSLLLLKLGWAKRPKDTSLRVLIGASLLCGIGFTMSLFVTELAFAGREGAPLVGAKLGILGPSILAALAGATVLLWKPSLSRRPRCTPSSTEIAPEKGTD